MKTLNITVDNVEFVVEISSDKQYGPQIDKIYLDGDAHKVDISDLLRQSVRSKIEEKAIGELNG